MIRKLDAEPGKNAADENKVTFRAPEESVPSKVVLAAESPCCGFSFHDVEIYLLDENQKKTVLIFAEELIAMGGEFPETELTREKNLYECGVPIIDSPVHVFIDFKDSPAEKISFDIGEFANTGEFLKDGLLFSFFYHGDYFNVTNGDYVKGFSRDIFNEPHEWSTDGFWHHKMGDDYGKTYDEIIETMEFQGRTGFRSGDLGYIYLGEDGYLVRIEAVRTDLIETGSTQRYTGSTIMKKGQEDIFVPDVALFPFGEYLIGYGDHYTYEFESVYDYNGRIVLKPAYNETFLMDNRFYDNRFYIVTEKSTKIIDNKLIVVGKADFEITTSTLGWLDYWHIEEREQFSKNKPNRLIFKKNGLYGICDTDLNVLVDAEYYCIGYYRKEMRNGEVTAKEAYTLYDKPKNIVATVIFDEDGTFEIKEGEQELGNRDNWP